MTIKLFVVITALLLIGCKEASTSASTQAPVATPPTNTTATPTDDPHGLQTLLNELDTGNYPDVPTAKPLVTTDGRLQIDWSQIDTKVTPIDPDSYPYPFALDSEPVKNYANAYNITAKQAQHSMMLMMASPEALGKVADQLTGKYLGHSFTDGAKMSLVIYTTSDVVAERHDYVFADKFGEGLVLPIVITPKEMSKEQ